MLSRASEPMPLRSASERVSEMDRRTEPETLFMPGALVRGRRWLTRLTALYLVTRPRATTSLTGTTV
jgi:hypothetical protein